MFNRVLVEKSKFNNLIKKFDELENENKILKEKIKDLENSPYEKEELLEYYEKSNKKLYEENKQLKDTISILEKLNKSQQRQLEAMNALLKECYKEMTVEDYTSKIDIRI